MQIAFCDAVLSMPKPEDLPVSDAAFASALLIPVLADEPRLFGAAVCAWAASGKFLREILA